jgi:hypothetical protein
VDGREPEIEAGHGGAVVRETEACCFFGEGISNRIDFSLVRAIDFFPERSEFFAVGVRIEGGAC